MEDWALSAALASREEVCLRTEDSDEEGRAAVEKRPRLLSLRALTQLRNSVV